MDSTSNTTNTSPAQPPDTLVDARGLVCPEPVRLAEQAALMLDRGEVLKVYVTDPAAPIDFEAWCTAAGNAYLGAREMGSWLEIRIRLEKPAGRE